MIPDWDPRTPLPPARVRPGSRTFLQPSLKWGEPLPYCTGTKFHIYILLCDKLFQYKDIKFNMADLGRTPGLYLKTSVELQTLNWKFLRTKLIKERWTSMGESSPFFKLPPRQQCSGSSYYRPGPNFKKMVGTGCGSNPGYILSQHLQHDIILAQKIFYIKLWSGFESGSAILKPGSRSIFFKVTENRYGSQNIILFCSQVFFYNSAPDSHF